MIGTDFATGKQVDLAKPEEGVRQEYEQVLVESYGYLKTDLDIEVPIPRGTGRFPDRADVVVYRDADGRDPARDIVGVVEVKRKTRRDGIDQLKSYMTATSAEWGVWTNGDDISYLCKVGAQVLDGYINNIPIRGQSIDDVGRRTKAELEPFARTELKSAFRRILNHLYANTNIGRREKLGAEMVKIIFAKIEDEKTYVDQPPQFRAETGEAADAVRARVNQLFLRVRDELQQDGIFSPHEELAMDPRSVAWVVGQLHNGSLLTTDTDVVGDAFEVFSESRFIGEKGEFFTPRGVVKVAVKIADPKPDQTICDPACGSGGFLIHAMKWVWSAMARSPRWRNAPDVRSRQREMSMRTVFGIDKETDLVKIAKAHMAIAGDGRSNIVHENALHAASEFQGDARTNCVVNNRFRHFDFILTNPPFGTRTRVLAADAQQFFLGHKWKKDGHGGWLQTDSPADRDPYVLFVERCLEMLRPGGVLGIVLPETVFHAPTLGYLRQFICGGNNVVAVIDLPHNTFRPHCNAKTCLIVLQKGVPQGRSVIMATPEQMGHDHNGKTLYRPGTMLEWDDLKVVLDELDSVESPRNQYVFPCPWADVDADVLVPRFYRAIRRTINLPADRRAVRVSELLGDGTIRAWDGHGSPSSQEKGSGNIPYIRVSDIVNWELYRNPVSGIEQEVYERFLRNKERPQAGDVIFVRRGSYRIGTVAMASPRDTQVLLTRELLTMRVQDNDHGITPAYLLAMLSSEYVQDQIADYVFYDTTMPTIGDRWKHLVLPIHRERSDLDHTAAYVDAALNAKWEAQEQVDKLRQQIGGVTT